MTDLFLLLTVTRARRLGYFPCFVPSLFALFAPHTSIIYIDNFKMSTSLWGILILSYMSLG
jgi:hypothetical protein